MLKLAKPDLTQFPPRSVRVRLGGYAHLPRLLDKARAHAAGKAGDYSYNCPLDEHFFDFTGIDPKAFLAKVKKGASDTEMLVWVDAKAKRAPHQVAVWTAWMETRSPGGADGHEWFHKAITKLAAGREDIRTLFDLLDLDDYVTFGGKA